jgi:microcystin-dependent protein
MPVTISGDGSIGGLELGAFEDVSGTPQDGEALMWSASNGKWQPSGMALGSLQDVSGLPAEGQALMWDSSTSKWAPSTMQIPESILPGTVMYFPQSSAPSGFLKANGADVSRTTYSNLFNAIGTVFGSGNGSTTFSLPDLRGEFIRSLDDGRGVDASRSLGSFQADENKAHTHHLEGRYGASSGAISTDGYWPKNNKSTGSSGGNESRPRNVALLACIKY